MAIGGSGYIRGLNLGTSVYLWYGYISGGGISWSDLAAPEDIGNMATSSTSSALNYSNTPAFYGLSTSSSSFIGLENYKISKIEFKHHGTETTGPYIFGYTLTDLNNCFISFAGGDIDIVLTLISSTQNVKLGTNTLNGVDTIKVTDATDATKKDIFKLVRQE